MAVVGIDGGFVVGNRVVRVLYAHSNSSGGRHLSVTIEGREIMAFDVINDYYQEAKCFAEMLDDVITADRMSCEGITEEDIAETRYPDPPHDL